MVPLGRRIIIRLLKDTHTHVWPEAPRFPLHKTILRHSTWTHTWQKEFSESSGQHDPQKSLVQKGVCFCSFISSASVDFFKDGCIWTAVESVLNGTWMSPSGAHWSEEQTITVEETFQMRGTGLEIWEETRGWERIKEKRSTTDVVCRCDAVWRALMTISLRLLPVSLDYCTRRPRGERLVAMSVNQRAFFRICEDNSIPMHTINNM